MDGWQLQCCGPPFQVGAAVAWTVDVLVDREFLGTVVGEDRRSADGWETEAGDLRFVDYIVAVDQTHA